MVTGVYKIQNKEYYFDESTGKMKTGIQRIGDDIFGFDEKTGEKLFGMSSVSGNTYYFDKITGKMSTGFITEDGNQYYFHPDDGTQVTGWTEIEGNECYFDLETGIRQLGFVKIDTDTYYLNEKGRVRGVQKIGEEIYGFSSYYGKLLYGYQNIDGKRYFFDETDGKMQTGLVEISDGVYYNFAPDGGVLTGLQEIDGKQYYFDKWYYQAKSGLYSVGDKLYYFDPVTFEMIKNEDITIEGIQYHIDEEGVVSLKEMRDSRMKKALQWGLKQLGTPYSHTEGEGFDCEMFVQFAYREAGIEIPRLCGSQAYQAYYDKERFQIIDSVEEAKPGDIFFYRDYEYEGVSEEKDNWNEIHHSALYLGDGKILEATAAGDGVVRVYDVREQRGSSAYLFMIGRYIGK